MPRLGRSRPPKSYVVINRLNPLDRATDTTAALGFNPAVSANVTVAPPVTTTVVTRFSPAIAATGMSSYVTTAALSFSPAIAASATWPAPVTITGAVKFSPAIAVSESTGSVPYTVNYCPNPAFQNGLTGYSAVNSANISLDTSNIIFGPASLLVTCPGIVAGEGCSTATATVLGATGSASVYLNGTGSVTVSAVDNGTVIASHNTVLAQSWTRVILSGLPFTDGDSVYLTITTTTANNAQFWLSGVQVENDSPAHAYCDGDQPGCSWVSGYYGVSQQLYQFPVVATSAEITSSPVVTVLDTNAVISALPLVSSERTFSSLVTAGSHGPLGAVTDFSVSLITDPDPAQTYVSWNNANLLSVGYRQSWAVFIPPQDYIVSNGEYLYKRAAFASLGWWFPDATDGAYALMTRFQAQLLPVTTGFGEPSPLVFSNPRTIQSLIVADRINFCTNPSFEVNTDNWTAVGEATIAQDGAVIVGGIEDYDDTIYGTGFYSLNITVNASGDGAETTIDNLITGYYYTASVYVQAGAGLNNILLSIADGATSVQSSGGTGYNYGTYNTGPYGGFDPVTDLPVDTWYRIYCTFQATSDSEILSIISVAADDVSYPTHMWADAVLVEQGEILGDYFDGGFGLNYSWDSASGSPGLARSYYYNQMSARQQAVLNVLERHTPQGISYAQPLYSLPPIA